MEVAVWRWDEARWGTPNVAVIRKLHKPTPQRFEIYPRVHEPGTLFPMVSARVRVYVLRGACEYRPIDDENKRWRLRAGDVSDLPGGWWWFEVVGSEPTEIVRVFDFGAEGQQPAEQRPAEPSAAPDPAAPHC